MDIKDWIFSPLGQDIWSKKYRYNGETFEQWLKRVSGGNRDVERLIREKKFLFGGRTLANRGTGKKASYSNCYSSGYVEDSIESICDLNKNLALTYKSQGGQGLSLSKIRPKGAPINNGQFESDGIVPFMEMFNQTTASISQGGSRKGALLMSLDCTHKEIETFINIKSGTGRIEKANLSVEVNDDFMNAVKTYYETGATIILNIKREYEGCMVEYEITPIDIYKLMMEKAYDYAEPGVIMVDRFRNYNLMQHHNEYEIVTGNPCGEQPLPKNGACNLGSLNLSEYVINPYTKNARFNMEEFEADVGIAVRGLDSVLDEGMEMHALQSQRDMAKNYRNIGLGIMGLGDMFFKLGIKYGSASSKSVLDKIMSKMFKSSIKESSRLAKEKGKFPKCDASIFESDIFKDHFNVQDAETQEIIKNGLRNCSLLSIAPAGSIGTMLDITTGIEPAFQLFYYRKTESLHKEQEKTYPVYLGSAKEYMKLHGDNVDMDNLPDYFVTSADIAWKDRVDIQAVAQNHVDTAISSTVNLPNKTTIEEVEQLYLYAHACGLKGITVYRDGCKRFGILTNDNPDDDNAEETSENKDMSSQELPWGTTIEASDDLIGMKKKIQTGCGSLHCQAWFDASTGKLMEVYLNKGGSGGCFGYMNALSRLISGGLRTGLDVDYAIDQLQSVPSCPSYVSRTISKKDTHKGSSCPSAIGFALKEMQKTVLDDLTCDEDVENEEIPVSSHKTIQTSDENKTTIKPTCPECGEDLRAEGGCVQCISCGWSKCD